MGTAWSLAGQYTVALDRDWSTWTEGGLNRMRKLTFFLAILALLVVAGCGQCGDSGSATVSNEPADGPAPAPEPANGPASPPPEPAQARIQTLFIIERSKNANIVKYDARLTADGKLDPEQPVEAYWVLHAADGRRAELNWFERQKAYGFSIQPAASGDGYLMSAVPLPKREIRVRKVDDEVRAELPINGHQSVLEKVYIESSAGLLGPKVHYVELYGKDVETGEERVEKIVPE